MVWVCKTDMNHFYCQMNTAWVNPRTYFTGEGVKPLNGRISHSLNLENADSLCSQGNKSESNR